MSKRSRCGAVRICLDLGEPSAEILRVEALAVAPCEFVLSPMNPLRGSCVSDRSRCGAVRICLEPDEPSAEIVRVEALSLWRRAIFLLAKRLLEVVSWCARLLSQSRGPGSIPPGPRQLRLAVEAPKPGSCDAWRDGRHLRAAQQGPRLTEAVQPAVAQAALLVFGGATKRQKRQRAAFPPFFHSLGAATCSQKRR